jgi:diaminopimelate decarboxylase
MAIQLAIDECLSVRNGRLFIEDCDADALARQFGTPVTVISEAQLRRNARRYRQEFGGRWPEGTVVVLASIKANFALATRWILSHEGIGCDAFGAGELYAALHGGVPPELLSVNGAIKSRELLETAVEAGARITLDSAAELELVRQAAAALGRQATVRFRLRPDFSALTEPTDWYEEPTPIAEAARLYKAGIPTDDVIELGRQALHMPELDLSGVHAHIGRHTNRTEQWPGIIDAYVDLLARLRDAWDGWVPRELNLGGGYPVPRDPFGRGMARLQGRTGPAPDLSSYAAVVTTSLRRALAEKGFQSRGLRLEIEPGRGMYGNAGIHLATVRNIKVQRTPELHRWIETDTSDMFLPDVVWEHNRWTSLVTTKADRTTTLIADIAGLSCQPDRIVADAALPDVEVGDTIAFLDTGAYQDGLAANFNALPRPGMVLVTGDGAEWIKRPESIDDVFARDAVPDRLRPVPPRPGAA